MLTDAQIDAIAAELAEADRTHAVIPRITARYPDAVVEDSDVTLFFSRVTVVVSRRGSSVTSGSASYLCSRRSISTRRPRP